MKRTIGMMIAFMPWVLILGIWIGYSIGHRATQNVQAVTMAVPAVPPWSAEAQRTSVAASLIDTSTQAVSTDAPSESSEPPTATIAPTDTPEPSPTPEQPTETPIVPTDTRIPATETTNPIMPTVTLPPISQEVALYASQMVEPYRALGNALNTLGPLFLHAQFDDDNWKIDVAVQLADIRNAYTTISNIKPPSEMITMHKQLTNAIEDCNTMTTVLPDAVDHKDVDGVIKADNLVKSCAAKMDQANILLQEYLHTHS